MICYIAGALPLPKNFKFPPQKSDFLIAADGGYVQLKKLGINPDLILGDFDSSQRPENHPHVMTLPVEKDDTDMGYAIKMALDKSYQNFVLLGGLGGLLDHTMANIQHLHSLSQQHCRAILVGDSQCATVISNSSLTLKGQPGGRCSVFALGGNATGVTLENLYYTLENANLSPIFPLGVSNSFLSDPSFTAKISVKQGSLLIIWDWNPASQISDFFD